MRIAERNVAAPIARIGPLVGLLARRSMSQSPARVAGGVAAMALVTAAFVGLCRELDLVPTGGSDFHGPAVRAATLGQPPVPWASYDALRRRAGR